MDRLKVIQVATGTVGTHSLRTIISRRDMELVGLLVYSPEKVGRDAGELIGGHAMESKRPTPSTKFSRWMQMR